MPELPEVEIVKQSLKKNINKKIIKNVQINNPNLRYKLPYNFKNVLLKAKIQSIQRFSKYIIFTLNNGFYIIMHLGMSGTVHVLKNGKRNLITNMSFYSTPTFPQKHNHIILFFNKIKIVYNDPRRFGFFKVFSNKHDLNSYFKNHGPEPFDNKFNISYLKKKLNNKIKSIKNYLLDQRFVSGVGNIYANEILFFCKINPLKKSGKLTNKDFNNLIIFSKLILKKAIKNGGSSIRNFKDTSGKPGSFQNNFMVYGRQNLKCLRNNCSGIIKKKTHSNRSYFYCNICQK